MSSVFQVKLLPIGFASGDVPQVPSNHLMVKNLSVLGVNWGGYMRFAPEVLTGSLHTLLGWIAEGRLTPHVSHVLPLDRAGEGLELLRNRERVDVENPHGPIWAQRCPHGARAARTGGSGRLAPPAARVSTAPLSLQGSNWGRRNARSN